MIKIENAKFVYLDKWVTDEYLGRINTGEKEKVSIRITYSIDNKDIKYSKKFYSNIDLFIFNPEIYEDIKEVLDDYNEDLARLFRRMKLQEDYIIFKHNHSLRISPKFSKLIRKLLIDNYTVVCDYDYWYVNRYNSKFKKYQPVSINEILDTILNNLQQTDIIIDKFNTIVI